MNLTSNTATSPLAGTTLLRASKFPSSSPTYLDEQLNVTSPLQNLSIHNTSDPLVSPLNYCQVRVPKPAIDFKLDALDTNW